MKKIFLLSIAFAIAFQLLHAASPLQVAKLTCEYIENPLGIDAKEPRLAWTFQSTARNQFQSAYEIIVSDNAKDIRLEKGNVWTTGKVSSSQNIQIEYAGNPLKSFTKYFWRVRVYNQNNEVSAWSDVNSFETSMLDANDWKATWISDAGNTPERDEDFYKDDRMPLFRKVFEASKKVASARLYISGLGYYEAYLNGKKIGDHVLDPGFTAYKKQVLYATYDITGEIKKGNNAAGIMLGNGWYNPLPLKLFGRFNLRDVQQTGRPCVKAEIHINYTDGSTEMIPTDESWQTAPGPITFNSVYLGEHYDARLEQKNWSEVNAGQSVWKNAHKADGPSGELTAQMQPAIKITKVLKPLRINEVGKDTFIVDIGQNFAGVVRLKIHAPAGTNIHLRYGELLFENGALNYLTTVAGQIKEQWHLSGGPGAPATAWQEDEYITKGESVETWSPRFTFHGFRYVEITGWNGTPAMENIEGLRMNSALEANGTFSCSNNMFNQLHEAIQWTFLSNVFSVESDCPGREKMGYGADMVAASDAYSSNYNMANFYSKAIHDFANDQQADGAITEIAPSTGIADRGYGGQSGPIGWELAFPYLQNLLYEYYGDTRIIKNNYEAFTKQIEFLQSKAVGNLFYWGISDHETLDPKPESFSVSAFYYHHVKLAANFAGILHKTSDSVRFEKLAQKIKEAIISAYHIPETGRFDNATEAAQIFSLWYDFAPQKDAAFNVLMDELKRHDMHISTGIFSTKMMFDVLRELDKNEVAYSIVNQKDYPGWSHMLAKGATTLWEGWQYSDNAESHNHPMFGSVDEWFYRSLLGINSAAPGFEKIIIRPQPVEDLQWAKGSYNSIHGMIESNWSKSNEIFTFHVSIPANTKATIYIPSKQNSSLTENGKPLTTNAEIKVSGYEDGYTVVETGSGDYTFMATLTE